MSNEMNFLQTGKGKKKFVRIIIGYTKTGESGVKKPIKTISLENTTVPQVFELIKEAINQKGLADGRAQKI
jgi:hypothetical protein